MVLQIEIPPQVEERLRQQAQAVGKDISAYVSQLIEQAAAAPNLDEALAPLREQFRQSGTSDKQLIDDITSAQAEYRAEKHSHKS